MSAVIIYILGCILFVIVVFILVTLWDIQMDLCSIMAHTERTYDILLKWATYYVVLEYQKGNNEPFDEIFPNNREKIEQDMQTLIKNKK